MKLFGVAKHQGGYMLPRIPLPNKGEGESQCLASAGKLPGADGRGGTWRGALGRGATRVLLGTHCPALCPHCSLEHATQFPDSSFYSPVFDHKFRIFLNAFNQQTVFSFFSTNDKCSHSLALMISLSAIQTQMISSFLHRTC